MANGDIIYISMLQYNTLRNRASITSQAFRISITILIHQLAQGLSAGYQRFGEKTSSNVLNMQEAAPSQDTPSRWAW